MAAISAQLTVLTDPLLLWQTTTGTPSDPAIDTAAQVFGAGTGNDPIPILVGNASASDTVWLGGSAVTADDGFPLLPLASVPYNVIGNDSLYAVSGGSVVVAVLVGRQ